MLEIDHILPVSAGDKDDINNLLTSCFGCNRGKGKTTLDILPNSVVENIAIMKEQQKQTKQYYKFLEGMEQRKENEVNEIGRYFFNNWAKTIRTKDKYVFSGNYKTSVKTFLKKLTKYEILEAVDIAYCRFNRNGTPNQTQVFKYMCGVCWNKIKGGKCPE